MVFFFKFLPCTLFKPFLMLFWTIFSFGKGNFLKLKSFSWKKIMILGMKDEIWKCKMDSWGGGSSCYPEAWNWEHLSVDRCYAELRKRLSEEWALSEPGSLVDRYCVKNDLVSKSLGVQTDLVSELICVQTTWCPDNLKTLCLTDLVTWCPNHLVSK